MKDEVRMQKEEKSGLMMPFLNSSFLILPLLAHQLFGDKLPALLDELNLVLAA